MKKVENSLAGIRFRGSQAAQGLQTLYVVMAGRTLLAIKSNRTKIAINAVGILFILALIGSALRPLSTRPQLGQNHPMPSGTQSEAPVCQDLLSLFEKAHPQEARKWTIFGFNPFRSLTQSPLNADQESILDASTQNKPNRNTLSVFGLSQRHRDFSKGLNFSEVHRVTEESTDLKNVLPQNLAHSNDAEGIATQVINHGLSQFFNGDMMKSTALGKAAKSVEKSMKTDVAIGGKEPNAIQHKIQFQVNAPAAQAFVQYSGLTNATLRYNIARQSTEVELSEPLAGAATMVFSHNSGPAERRDVLSIRLPW